MAAAAPSTVAPWRSAGIRRSGVDPRTAAAIGPAWGAWDPATGVPRHVVPTRLSAPGTSASAHEAERFAATILREHLPLLAPGAAASDFVLVTNDLSAGIRTLGFVQHAD